MSKRIVKMCIGSIDTQVRFVEDFLHSRSRLPVGVDLRGGHIGTYSGGGVFQDIRSRVMTESIIEMCINGRDCGCRWTYVRRIVGI